MSLPHSDDSPLRADPAFSISSAELRVYDLERQVRFYHDMLGLYVQALHAGRVGLSDTLDGRPLIVLSSGASAAGEPRGAPCLYHLGLRCPSRAILATCTARMIRHGLPIDGTADHGVSEAVYFRDAEGNQVELYVDRPEDRWRNAAGEIVMTGSPLDLNDLLQEELLTSEPVTDGVRLGHVHLHVTNLDESESFYRYFMGLALTYRMGESARFLAAGDYHHHIGINTWVSPAPSSPDEDVTGLARLTVTMPRPGCRELYDHARDNGAHLTGAPYRFTLTDPDGLLIDVEET